MQETYLRALNALDRYKPGTNFTARLTKIAKNLALNHIKRAGREVISDFSDEAEIRRYGSGETELPYIFDIAAKILDEIEYEIIMLCQTAVCLLNSRLNMKTERAKLNTSTPCMKEILQYRAPHLNFKTKPTKLNL